MNIRLLSPPVALGAALACCAAPLRGANAPGPPSEYLVDVWNTERGLPHSTVTSIAQTPDGYLWVGTLHGGLARFDGARFVAFHPGNTPAFPSIEVQQLLVDARGALWISMVEGALLALRDGVFRQERFETPTPQAWLHSLVVNRPDEVVLSTFGGWLHRVRTRGGARDWDLFKAPDGDSLSSYCEDREGRIWYRTSDAGAGVFQDGQFRRASAEGGLAGRRVHAVTRDAAGRVWVGTDRGFFVGEDGQFREQTPTNGAPDLPALQLTFASDGGLWVRTDTGLRKCAGRRWVAEARPWEGRFRLSVRPLELRADPQGGVWLAHYSDGLWHVDAEGRVARVSDQEGLPTNQIECCFQDREGNLWVGLSGGGLARVRRRGFQLVWPEGEPREHAARSVCEDAAGAMWFGTSGEAFLRWREGEFTRVVPPAPGAPGRDGTVCPDAAGRVWLGSVLNGVWVWETNALWRPFPPTRPGIATRALHGDAQGRMWIGNEFGFFVWENGERRTLAGDPQTTPGFVAAIAEARDGRLWLGNANGELCEFDPASGRFAVHRPPDFSPAVRFWAALADADGGVWIGTLGGGLLRFKEGRFTRFTARDGLPSDHVSQLLEGPRGELWLGTRAGIGRVRKEDLERFARGDSRSVPCVTYGRDDGLPTAECSSGYQPGCWRSRDGRLWFATVKGVVCVQPRALPFNPLPPPVVIEEVRVDGQRRLPGTAAGGGESGPAGPAGPLALEVGPGPRHLEIAFTGLSFVAPGKVRFKHRLEGLESEWVEVGHARRASYHALPPGDYHFRVLACNNDGVWNEAGATLALRVRPHFWQTWWFKLAVAVALVAGSGGAIGGFERAKARRKLARLQQQRALEQERARIAKDMHDDLGASLTRITLLSESARGGRDEPARSAAALDRIAATARELTHAMDEIVWAVNPRHDRLDSLVNYLGKFAQDFLGDADVAYRLDVPARLPRRPVGSQTRHNLFLAFKEALHNVVKHAAATEARVAVALEAGRLVLRVVDNGRGFGAVNPGPRAVGGNGLANMRARLAEIGGQCEVRSTPGQGTNVTLVVPVREEA